MKYRWSIPATLEIYQPVPAARHVVTTAGGRYPVVDRLPGGRLALKTKEGDLHVGERGRLVVSFSDDGGESWSETRPILSMNPDPCHDAFGCTSRGTMIEFYVQPHAYREGFWQRDVVRPSPPFVTRSEDLGQTWSEPTAIETPFIPSPSVHYFRRTLELPDGTLLLSMHGAISADGGPLSYERPRLAASFVVRSRDDGRTWGDASEMSRGWFVHPAFLRLPSGKLLASVLNHDYSGGGRAFSTWLTESEDEGYTWSEPRPVTQPGDYWADLVRLRDGRLLLVYAHRGAAPYGVRGLISRDEGRTWDYDRQLILSAEGTSTNAGFPTAIVLDDGNVLVFYHICESSGPFVTPGTGEVARHYCGAVKFQGDDLP